MTGTHVVFDHGIDDIGLRDLSSRLNRDSMLLEAMQRLDAFLRVDNPRRLPHLVADGWQLKSARSANEIDAESVASGAEDPILLEFVGPCGSLHVYEHVAWLYWGVRWRATLEEPQLRSLLLAATHACCETCASRPDVRALLLADGLRDHWLRTGGLEPTVEAIDANFHQMFGPPTPLNLHSTYEDSQPWLPWFRIGVS